MRLNPNCSELVLRLDDNWTKKEFIEECKRIGIYFIEINSKEFYKWDTSGDKMIVVFDKDNPNMPDFTNTSSMILYEDGEENGYGDEGLRVDCHQHCQHQLFPTLFKIENHFGGEVFGQDGGSSGGYYEWINKGHKPIKNYQDAISRKKRKELLKRPDVSIK